MASNKAATAMFMAMIFAVEVAMAHHFHHLPRDAIRNSHTDSVRHYKVNGFDFKMEKGHEACYVACYKNVFVSESSPFTAEKMCHNKCSSDRRSLFSASALATATHTISSSAITAAKKPAEFLSTNVATEMPVAFSSTGAAAAAEKPAVSSTDTTAKKPSVSSAGTAAEAPSVSSAGTAAEAPAVSSAGTATEAPAVSSTDSAAEAPGVWSAGTEETNFGNPYS